MCMCVCVMQRSFKIELLREGKVVRCFSSHCMLMFQCSSLWLGSDFEGIR